MTVRNTKLRLQEEAKKKRRRRFIKKSIFFSLIMAFLLTAVIQIYKLTSPFIYKAFCSFSQKYLLVKELSITGASDYADHEIRSYVEPIIKVTPNIFYLPINQIKGFLYTRGYLKSAEVRLELPGRVVIEVSEKRPVAMLIQNGFYLLDENGEIIRPMNIGENIDVPVITIEEGINIKAAHDMIKTACNIIQLDDKSLPLLMPSELKISTGLIIVKSLELKNKQNKIPPIYFSCNDIEKKVLYVKKLWAEIVNKKEQLEYVDGRFREGVLVKLKTTEVKDNG